MLTQVRGANARTRTMNENNEPIQIPLDLWNELKRLDRECVTMQTRWRALIDGFLAGRAILPTGNVNVDLDAGAITLTPPLVETLADA